MIGLYYNFAKKSTLVAILGIFLFSSLSAEARVPNDPEYSKQQSMWQQIGAERAWDYTTGSKKVTVAIIDTGADIWHDDLKANIWTNPYEIPDNNYDDDGNGYVDDVHGWNFVENNSDVRTGVFDNADDPEAISHGTVITGLVGGVGDNGRNGTGLNWQVQIMPLRAIASDGTGSYAEVEKSVRYAIDNGADVIGLSVVGDKDDIDLKKILREAYDKGIVIVAAAGNDQLSGSGNLNNTKHYPVCMDGDSLENWIIGVSSIDENNLLSKFANYGNCVDLVAPGENIFSTERYAPTYGYNKEFGGPWRGTSFSVPLVAGAAALLKSQRPDWSAKEIISMLLKNADSLQIQNSSFSDGLGFGRLNIGRATAEAALISIPVDFSSKEKYFFKNDIIYTLQNDTKYFFASAGNAKIVSGASTRSFNNKRDEVVTLVVRGKHYYVQFFTDDGHKWKELAVPTTDYSASKQPTGIKAINNDQDRKIQLVYLEIIKKKVKKITKTTKKTSVKDYDWLNQN